MSPRIIFPTLSHSLKLDKYHVEFLNKLLEDILTNCQQADRNIKERDECCTELEKILKRKYDRVTPVLSKFGSSANGFGTHQCDLDLSLTFKFKNGNKMPKKSFESRYGPDERNIEMISAELKKHINFVQVHANTVNCLPHTNMKYKKGHSLLECNLSLYNLMAERNSHLLLTYSQIDKRARTLGFAFKKLMKMSRLISSAVDDGDGGDRYLSSYAILLMLIHFLQRVQPPVLPPLQKFKRFEKKETLMGCDVWFFHNVDDVKTEWDGYMGNKMEVGDLWLRLLTFYSSEFDFNKSVVSIRETGHMSKREKGWTDDVIAIEDPFKLQHNVAGQLSRR
ncbi:hypothetical protein HELRODRAFT_190956, partial [Helobdella robusta]|uniref:Uncharacterized protein n=1 Tax=Helobdella robusta TaxID=6412 RepID=T1FSG5_HELRO